MEELAAGIRDLHSQVKRLDDVLRETQAERDISERLSASAASEASEAGRIAALAHELMRWVIVAMAAGLLIWTPVVAYGAVWFHELVRNNCYPSIVARVNHDEPLYCGIFPGTGHQAH